MKSIYASGYSHATISDFCFQTEPLTYTVSLLELGAYFFSVDPNSGLMRVRTELTKDDALSYTVSVNITLEKNWVLDIGFYLSVIEISVLHSIHCI